MSTKLLAIGHSTRQRKQKVEMRSQNFFSAAKHVDEQEDVRDYITILDPYINLKGIPG